jgi:hypothetical protein
VLRQTDDVRTAHRIIGLAFIAVFLATGLYMRFSLPDAARGDFGVRMMFRSRHIYILFSALLNLMASAHYREGSTLRRRRVHVAGSVMLLAAPPLLTIAFTVEPTSHGRSHLLTLLGVAFALTGTILHVVASREKPAA